jgi:hypothetical protein
MMRFVLYKEQQHSQKDGNFHGYGGVAEAPPLF